MPARPGEERHDHVREGPHNMSQNRFDSQIDCPVAHLLLLVFFVSVCLVLGEFLPALCKVRAHS